jgi:serine phosphatase RsbU (regulator of sigma subunit)
MLGEEKVKDIIKTNAVNGAQVLEQKLLEAVQSFTEGRSQTDDITLMIVEKT